MSIRIAAMALALTSLSIPAMAAGCGSLHDDYEAANGPKAFAVGSGGGCGYSTAKSATSLADAKRRAMAACESNARNCRITEASGR